MHHNRHHHHHQAPEIQHHHNHHNHQHQHQQQRQSVLNSPHPHHQTRYHYRYAHDFDDIDDRIFEYNNHNTNYNLSRSHNMSPSPVREQIRETPRKHQNKEKKVVDYDLDDSFERHEYDSAKNAEEFLKYKWMDNTPRMNRIRDHRNKRLMNRLEQFELWDLEQEQKQKQFELAREQRYTNIVERLKTQDFCLDQMRKRHESDIETSRYLEVYEDEHFYVDPLDNLKQKSGPISQFRRFQAEMDNKVKTLQTEIDSVNPRNKIEQTILPRLERTRVAYSVEPEIYTNSGKRLMKRPARHNKEEKPASSIEYKNLDEDDAKCVKFYYPSTIREEDVRREKIKLELEKENEGRRLKSIINNDANSNHKVDETFSKLKLSNEKKVYFEDDIENKRVEKELASEMVVKTNDDANNKPTEA